jgi:hypothetical protein
MRLWLWLWLPPLILMGAVHYQGAASFGVTVGLGAFLATFFAALLVVLAIYDASLRRWLWAASALVIAVSNLPNTAAFFFGHQYEAQVWGNTVLITLMAALGYTVTNAALELFGRKQA